MTEKEKTIQGHILDESEQEKVAYEEMKKREEEQEELLDEQSMGDVYDVYQKAVAVHSKLSGMTEDYTLTRYDLDIYNMKFPKFIREQRKILRIIKSYLIIPLSKLKTIYNDEKKAKLVYVSLVKEFKLIESLLLGELDECIIMGRTPNGEVLDAFLKHGLNPTSRDEYEKEIEQPNIKDEMRRKG